MTRPDARERWARRVLGGVGARPVGHADPDDEGPQVPTTPPVPTASPQSPPRITEWWKQGRPEIGRPVDDDQPPAGLIGRERTHWYLGRGSDDQPPAELTGPQRTQWYLARGEETLARLERGEALPPVERAEAAPEAPEAPAEERPEPRRVKVLDEHEDQDDEPDEQEPVTPGLASDSPVEKVPFGQKRTTVRMQFESAAEDQRLRFVAFNLTAAGVGYSFGLVQLIRASMPVAEHAATGVFGLVLAATGAWAGWRATRFSAVRAVFQARTPLFRLVVSGGAAGIGHEVAPVPVAYLNTYGQEWGLGPSAISLLITAAGICGLLWWFIDRRLRRFHWFVRWMFRIPLASALIACIPYGSTPVA